MPLNKELSVVADSTGALSPRASASSPVILRQPRTYGRKRDAEPGTPTPVPEGLASSSRLNVYRTAPPEEANEEIPASSPSRFSDVGEDDDSKPVSLTNTYSWGWRKTLKQMDDQEDFDVDYPENSDSQPPQFGKPQLLSVAPTGVTTRPASPTHGQTNASIDDVFISSLTSLPTSSASNAFQHPPIHDHISPPPTITKHARRLTKHKNIVHDSDSEEEISRRVSPCTDSSPNAVPHSINTPKATSSPTPPTSDDELPADPMASTKLLVKGKRVASVRPSVPALSLIEASPNTASARNENKESKRALKKPSKFKAPTKKDEREIALARAKLAEQQDIAIKRTNPKQFTLQGLFTTLAVVKEESKSKSLGAHPSSDSIQPFTSPPRAQELQENRSHPADVFSNSSPERIPLPVSLPESVLLPPPADSDDEMLPSLDQIEAVEEEKRAKEARQKNLREMKHRALEKANRSVPFDSDDDDLVVIDSNAKGKGKNLHSSGERRRAPMRRSALTLTALSGSAERKLYNSVAAGNGTSVHRVAPSQAVSQAKLSKQLIQQVTEKNIETTKKKEEEWKRRGGKINADPVDASVLSINEGWRSFAEQGLKVVESNDGYVEDGDDEGDGDSDDEWSPDGNGSGDEDQEMKFNEVVEDANNTLGENTEGEEFAGDEETQENEQVRLPRRRPAIVSDDDSDQENTNPSGSRSGSLKIPALSIPSRVADNDSDSSVFLSSRSPKLNHRLSTSSLEPMVDECDKENNTRLMYDRCEDKENKAVARHDVFQSWDSESPRVERESDQDEDYEAINRRPLKDLLSEGSPLASYPASTSLTQTFVEQLQHTPTSSSGPKPLSWAPSLLPFINNSEKEPGFSQFLNESQNTNRNPELLQPGFSESRNVNQKLPHKPITFEFTQEVGLRPAFQATEDVMRKANQIFEKEQEFLLGAVSSAAEERELYVNDLGFLTQTRPEVSTPEVYRHPLRSPTIRRSGASPTSGPSQRTPLRTLSISGSIESISPGDTSLRRLRKRSRSPTPAARDKKLAGHAGINAFDMLARGAAQDAKAKQKMAKSDFIAMEAEESDDDDGFGFRSNDKGDDDDEENLDASLPALLDDHAMDADTLASELVLEKYAEQREVDDAKAEELAKAAVAGEFRKRRRNGAVGLDDSDEESDEDGTNERIRRSMNKKQKIDRQSIKSLAEDQETQPFYQVYAQDVIDADEAENLYEPSSQGDITVVNSTQDQDILEEEDEAGDAMRWEDVQQRVREIAEQPEMDDVLDPNDVTWVDSEEDDDVVRRIKNVTRQSVGSRISIPTEFDDGVTIRKVGVLEGELTRERQKEWYKNNAKGSRHARTGRRTEGTAVTGHGRVKAKSDRRASNSSANTVAKPTKAAIRAEGSVLAGVDRSSRFG